MKDTAPLSISKYTGSEYYEDVYPIYLKNKELINLNTEGVTLESAYNNEFFQYIKNNHKFVKNCRASCSVDYKIMDRLLGTKEIYHE